MTSVIELDPLDARADWLEWRRKGIGGSDVAALCGMSRYATPMSTYLDKTGMLDDQDAGEAALWGRLLEIPISTEFENRTDLTVVGQQLCVTDERADWRRATLDGLVTDTRTLGDTIPNPNDLLASVLGTFEAKASSQFSVDEDNAFPCPCCAALLPNEYGVQCQWQMGITGLAAGWLAILQNGRKLVIHELAFEPATFEGLCSIADRFWHDHVLARVAPPADSADATTRALKDAYRELGTGTAVELSDDVALLARGWLAQRAAVKRSQAQLDLIENQLRAALGEATIGTYAGEELVTWKPQKTGRRFVLEALQAMHPDLDVELFMSEPGTTRVLRPTKVLKAMED